MRTLSSPSPRKPPRRTFPSDVFRDCPDLADEFLKGHLSHTPTHASLIILICSQGPFWKPPLSWTLLTPNSHSTNWSLPPSQAASLPRSLSLSLQPPFNTRHPFHRAISKVMSFIPDLSLLPMPKSHPQTLRGLNHSSPLHPQ